MRTLFLAHSVWQMANKFGKKCANLSLKLEVLIVGEIEQQIFLCRGDFLIDEKVWWNRPLVYVTLTMFSQQYFNKTIIKITLRSLWF